MAIGGNHFIHLIRRNIDINLIFFNNRIYGLTKGQYSPTSDRGVKTKTSPFGTIEDPFVPGQLVIGARGTFFARTIDSNIKLSQSVFEAAANHKGTSAVEVLQNCVIFNNGIHDEITDPQHRAERQLFLEHGKPMVFGNDNERGLIFDKGKLKVAVIGENGITLDDILVHDAYDADPTLHMAIINMKLPDMPVAFGVIRSVPSLVYDVEMEAQIKQVQQNRKITCVDELLNSGNIWEVTGNVVSSDEGCQKTKLK